jgi:hypothetical protein
MSASECHSHVRLSPSSWMAVTSYHHSPLTLSATNSGCR